MTTDGLDPAVFDHAAALVRAGWVRFTGQSDEGRCALNALAHAASILHAPDGYRVSYFPYVELVADVIGRDPGKIGNGDRVLLDFNDFVAKTADDVIAVFETCAEKVRAEL